VTGPTAPAPPTSYALDDALRAATATLAAAGVASPRTDAEALAALALGVERRGVVAALASGAELTAAQADALAAAIERRRRREPLQHITGVAGFRYLDIAVGPGVFVPRPETELVAGAAIAAAAAAGPRPVVVDLCAGSGAIALAVATELPAAEVHAVEREAAAMAYARRNATATGADVRLVHADIADALAELDGSVDVVVSNPPYVPEDERPIVAAEVRYDPPAALWGGADGLDTIRTVCRVAARLLRRGSGVLVMEHADRHGAAVPALLAGAGDWTDIADHADLAGRPRYVTARRRP
jgi:release factor glutamine methyltransferase